MGYFGRAQSAVEKTREAEKEETATLNELENTVDKYTNGEYQTTKPGEGKEDENIVKISDKASLEEFRNKVNSGEKYENKTIILTMDIDLQGNESNKWTPIGNTEENAFTGTFDGDGHKITNIYIDTASEYQGLFGYNKGTIKNVGMESGTIKANGNTGSIAGHNSGTVEKCYNKINMECNGGNKFGGIVGVLTDSGIVSKCYNEGDLQAENMVDCGCLSGIVGWSDSYDTTVQYCYNTGDITNKVTTRKKCKSCRNSRRASSYKIML